MLFRSASARSATHDPRGQLPETVLEVGQRLRPAEEIALADLASVRLQEGEFATRPDNKIRVGVAAGKRSSLTEAKAEKPYAHKECGEEKSEHFDFNAESTVSMRSNPVATLEFVDGKLRARELGLDAYTDKITVPKGNDISVMFRNKTEGEHRLTLFYGTTKVTDKVVEENVTCTQMIGNDKEQILTFKIPKSSIASDKPYEFYVPGAEDQSIEVFVP